YPWTPQDADIGADAIYQGSVVLPATYGGGAPLRPGYYLGGFHAGDFKTPNPTFVADGNALSLFPENNPTTGDPCYVPGPTLSDILSGAASPGPIPCKPGVGRNSFRGPGYFDIDTSIGKSFGLPAMKFLGENAKFNFTANFYNLFNKVNLTNVNTN